MKKTRRKFSATFKAKVAIESIKERCSLAELSKKFEIHPNQISKWKQEFLDNASSVFDNNTEVTEESGPDADKLYAKIGELQLENDFLKKSLKKVSG
ncbi:MAG TPA: transposase [Pedobacter sp.]|jgi:transposase-like protein